MRKEYYGNYLGICINNQDPERRGRIQVFVPHIMPTLYDGWNKDGKDITLTCVGDNLPQGLNSDIIDRLTQILPWAESASPIIGTSAPGNLISGAVDAVGNMISSAAAAVGAYFDQSPTTDIPATNIPTTPPPEITGSLKFNARSTSDNKSTMPGGEGGNWAGSIYKVNSYLPSSFTTSSQKRFTPGGAGSDHKWANTNAYAVDLGVNSDFGGSTEKTHQTAIQIVNSIRAELGQGPVSDWSPYAGKVNIFTMPDGYQVKLIWQAANHYDHIHLGAQWPKNTKPRVSESAKPGAVPASSYPDGNLVSTASENTSSQTTTSTSEKGDEPTSLLASDNIKMNLGGGQSPSIPNNVSAVSGGGQGISSTVSGGGTVTTGNSKLAADRQARFGTENQEATIARLQILASREVGNNPAAIQAFTESVVNRAYFSNRSLDKVLYESGYGFTDKTTATPSPAVREAFSKVMGGSNMTNLATDAGFNLPNSGRGKGGLFITGMQSKDYVITGAIDNATGKQITDPVILNKLYTEGDKTGKYEFFVRQSRSTSAEGIEKYAQENGIQSDGFQSDILPTLDASSDLNSIVNNTYGHGPVAVKNTNDMPAGLFAYPSPGAMIWVFFREGNPLFPVYFAASYSQSEWSGAYRQGSAASGIAYPGEGPGGGHSHSTIIHPIKGGGGLEISSTENLADSSKDQKNVMLYADDGSNVLLATGLNQYFSQHDRLDHVEEDRFNITMGYKEEWVQGDSNQVIMGDCFIKIGDCSKQAVEALNNLAEHSRKMNEMLIKKS